jgi:hypothetical protein
LSPIIGELTQVHPDDAPDSVLLIGLKLGL